MSSNSMVVDTWIQEDVLQAHTRFIASNLNDEIEVFFDGLIPYTKDFMHLYRKKFGIA